MTDSVSSLPPLPAQPSLVVQARQEGSHREPKEGAPQHPPSQHRRPPPSPEPEASSPSEPVADESLLTYDDHGHAPPTSDDVPPLPHVDAWA